MPLLTQRQDCGDDEDSSFAWLITFADLMTILLVFAFVMIVSGGVPSTLPVPVPTPVKNAPMLMDTAYASRPESAVQTPVYLPHTAPVKFVHRGDRVVERITLPLSAAGLSAHDEIRLTPVAALMQHNTTLRLVLHPPAGVNPQQWSAPLTELRSYLDMACKIDPARIYIQPARVCRPTGSQPTPMIELTLEQPFWEL